MTKGQKHHVFLHKHWETEVMRAVIETPNARSASVDDILRFMKSECTI